MLPLDHCDLLVDIVDMNDARSSNNMMMMMMMMTMMTRKITTIFMRWLQLRNNFDSTPLDFRSTAIRRPTTVEFL